MTVDDGPTQATHALTSLKPHEDARAIVRLLQCQQCSYPISEPMTLPCGNSLCKRCLPPTFKRENISYPADPRRSEGFACPFRDCNLQHTLGDCSLDVSLNKTVEIIRSLISTIRSEATDVPLLLDEKLHWPNLVESAMDVMPRSRVLHGGRFVATYVFADMGELDYYSEVAYVHAPPASEETIEALDVSAVNNVIELVRGELECQVCYSLMLDPLTTFCGHTFCRKCVARVLDHSSLCPVCRRRLQMPPGVQADPTNKRISAIISGLFTESLAARVLLANEETGFDEESRVPLFPCTLAYPRMPTFLHIFEPRYRLMIRRVLENESRKFGLLGYNQLRRPQGLLGNVPFMEYGTMLNIDQVEMLEDGRSLIQTTGVYRFRVLEYSILDGYMVGRIQRIEDVSIAEEEAREMQETSGPEPDPEDHQGRFNHMPTQQLLQYCLAFIAMARARSAAWLPRRIFSAFGEPPTDPALFPYWFATVLPISDEEKYLLLPTDSVRERLKITARWVHRLESATCIHTRVLARTVLDSSSDEGTGGETEDDDEEAEPPSHTDTENPPPAVSTGNVESDHVQQPPSTSDTHAASEPTT